MKWVLLTSRWTPMRLLDSMISLTSSLFDKMIYKLGLPLALFSVPLAAPPLRDTCTSAYVRLAGANKLKNLMMMMMYTLHKMPPSFVRGHEQARQGSSCNPTSTPTPLQSTPLRSAPLCSRLQQHEYRTNPVEKFINSRTRKPWLARVHSQGQLVNSNTFPTISKPVGTCHKKRTTLRAFRPMCKLRALSSPFCIAGTSAAAKAHRTVMPAPANR